MIQNIKGYSYNDLTLVPAEISNVSSRSECNPFISEKWLPIFTAPMASVVNFENYEIFLDNGITPIIPRNISLEVRKDLMNDQKWVALSLKEFEDLFINNYLNRIGDKQKHYYIVVDIANGHMKSLYKKCHTAKKNAIAGKYELTIMTGNIANPETYKWICKFNRLCGNNVIDYIRVGIGGGSGCITTSNVSTHYPQASLIDECYHIKQSLLSIHNDLGELKYKKSLFPKIVADGGIRNYDHVIKALALGADYVMIGSLFAQCIESAGVKSNKENTKIQFDFLNFHIERYRDFEIDGNGNWWAYYTDESIKSLSKSWQDEVDKYKNDTIGTNTDLYLNAYEKLKNKLKDLQQKKFIGPIDVKFFGMASADGQKSISGKKTKTAEGITKYLPVKYTLSGWVENMISYLRSAMSYCDCFKLEEFIGKPTLIVNSISEIHAVNK